MKKTIIFLLIFTSFCFSRTLYKDKIWYIKPKTKVKTIKTQNFIMFSAHIKGLNYFQPYGSKIFFKSDFNDLTVTNADFSDFFQTRDIVSLIKGKKGRKSILIPYKNSIYILFKDKENRCFHIFNYNFKKNKSKFVLTLNEKHYPGYTAIKKVKEEWKQDPSFKKDWFNFIDEYADFSKGWAFKDKLILFNAPNHGLFYGRVLIIDLKRKKVEKTVERVETVYGANENYVVYSKLIDRNAGEVGNTLYLFKNGREFKIDKFDIPSGAALNGNAIVYTKNRSLMLYNAKKRKKKAILKLNLEKPVVLGVSKTGNRIFIGEKKDGRHALYLYDTYLKKLILIKDKLANRFPSPVYSSYDGEYNTFSIGEDFYRLYLNDYSKPALTVSFKGKIYKGMAYGNKITATCNLYDRCFVSGTDGKIKVNGKEYSEKQIKLNLKEGENTFRFEATDRAGNKTTLIKKITYQKPIVCKIKDIDQNPEKYNGKFVILKGFAWGWANIKNKEDVEKYSKLPFTKNNTATSRSDGSFSDGEYRIFLPHFTSGSKHLTIIALIKTKNGKWKIEVAERE